MFSGFAVLVCASAWPPKAMAPSASEMSNRRFISPPFGSSRSGGLGQPQRADRVVLQYEWLDLGPESRRVIVLHPAFGRDQRIVCTEQHLGFQLRIRIVNQLRREVLWRPAREI